MPTTKRTRTVAAPPAEVWTVVGDPHHLPRWWPRVARVESVDGGRWTKVLITPKGKAVRADYRLVDVTPLRQAVWEQELEDTPFERLLSRARTEIDLDAVDDGTRVTITLRQALRGWSRFGGGLLFRRAARRQLDEALAGLARIHDGS